MIIEKYLTPNKFSRPGRKALFSPEAIAIHWVANPRTDAMFNRDYFETLKGLKKYGSAHAIVDDRDIVLAVPSDEVAFHVGKGGFEYTAYKVFRFGERYPNHYVLGIELCHPDWRGWFREKTVRYAMGLCAIWCAEFGLDPEKDILMHNNIVKKDCPPWYVAHPEEFTEFKRKVGRMLE